MMWDPEGGENTSGRILKSHLNPAWRTAEMGVMKHRVRGGVKGIPN